jgi:hypothetical protein
VSVRVSAGCSMPPPPFKPCHASEQLATQGSWEWKILFPGPARCYLGENSPPSPACQLRSLPLTLSCSTGSQARLPSMTGSDMASQTSEPHEGKRSSPCVVCTQVGRAREAAFPLCALQVRRTQCRCWRLVLRRLASGLVEVLCTKRLGIWTPFLCCRDGCSTVIDVMGLAMRFPTPSTALSSLPGSHPRGGDDRPGGFIFPEPPRHDPLRGRGEPQRPGLPLL